MTPGVCGRLLLSSVTHLRISSPQNIHEHIREPMRSQMLTKVTGEFSLLLKRATHIKKNPQKTLSM